jgi:hypothetical protein
MNQTNFKKESLAFARLTGLEIINPDRNNLLKLVNQVRVDRFDPAVIKPERRKDKMNKEKKILNSYKKIVKDFNALESAQEQILFMKRRKTKMALCYKGVQGYLAPTFKIPENESDKINSRILEISGDLKDFQGDMEDLLIAVFEILGLTFED